MSSEDLSIRDSFDPYSKIFYCNGMITTREEAEAHAAEIQKLTLAKVELHHNDTTSIDKAIDLGVKVLVGAGLVSYADGENNNSEKRVGDVALKSMGQFLVDSGFYDYSDIQTLKNESAKQLADKVTDHLKQNRHCHATLIFHSQGADIGRRALIQLIDYKHRIHVVTIGGIVDIPDGVANRVINFVDDNDVVAQVAKATFNPLADHPLMTHTQLVTKNGDCQTTACHGAADYLRNPDVRRTISVFSFSGGGGYLARRGRYLLHAK